MTNVAKLALTALLGMSVLSTSALADTAKGQKLYMKKMKKVCDVSGAAFAAKHSQGEWEEAKEDGTLIDAFVEACPAGEKMIRGDKFKKKYESHIYDFVYDYASDSGNVPSC
ncbi:MAG: cytochrome C [Campylobacterota bacterium]|nr:cytochrome C [Campylobacterota bacterium]